MAIETKVAEFLKNGPTLCHRIGNRKSMCSMAAINLALFGNLTDETPDCMSKVIGAWIIPIQDQMPLDMLNSHAWRGTLSSAAGTGRQFEVERSKMVEDWLFDVVLPTHQNQATACGYGGKWALMCNERTSAAIADAADAASAAVRAIADAAADADVYAIARIASAASVAAGFAYVEVDTASAASVTIAARSYALAAAHSASATPADDFWATIDPPALLARLVAVGSE